MHRRHNADADAPTSSSSPSQAPGSPHAHRAPGDPRASTTSPIASGSGSGSSSGKLLQWSFADDTSPSLGSYVHTSQTSLTTPEFPRLISPGAGGKHIPLSAVTGLQAPSPGTSPPSQAASPASPANETSTSSSSDEQLPTRASIRAWAKATPAGPPRNSPSPWGSEMLPQSRILDRHSVAGSAGRRTVSPVSQDGASGSGSSTDEDDRARSRNLPFPEDSSGNVADIESSGSGGEDMAPQDTSEPASPPPFTSPPDRELLAPAPLHSHPHQSQAHPGSSSSESPPLAGVIPPAGIQEQQDRIDRRVDRHHRRRHRDRDRERRARPSNPTPTPPQHDSQPQGRPHGHSTLAPLRLIPDRPLPAPPPLRPLQLVSSGGGDLFDDISRMLQFSRRPLLRTGVDPGGTRRASRSPPRNNDVLVDIWCMIQMSNGR